MRRRAGWLGRAGAAASGRSPSRANTRRACLEVRIGDVDHVVFSKCTAAAGDGPAPAVIYVVGADVRENSPGALPETDRNAAMNAG